MKLLLPFLVMSALCSAQNAAERQKIVATYDQNSIQELREKSQRYLIEQTNLINEYIKNNPSYKESEYHSLQRVFDGIPHFFTISNDASSKTLRTNAMYPGGALGLSVTGAGITAGVWDGGKVRNVHQEFTGRVTLSDAADELSPHATHVTGTIIAAGISATRKGIAYGASAQTHDWDGDYDEMIAFGGNGFLVSNHSYGYQTGELPNWKFGSYDGSSIEIDEISNTFPYYQIVIAAGNDRNSDLEQVSIKGGYDMLSGTGVSKNGITVAAVEEVLDYSDPFSVVMSDFSNFGPTDDGRIKPDIAAKGVNTNSCISSANYAYDTYSGTSMAAPAITGMIIMLQKHYNNLYGSFMRASTVRGLICHSAREAGYYEGPDYEYGFGLADAQTAAGIISTKGLSAVLEEHVLEVGGTFTRQISIASAQKLIATISWTDPVGNANTSGSEDNRVSRIKNNLDIKILKDGETFYPWKLSYEDPSAPATRDSDNNVDNVEKVEIDNALPGIYTIQVKHKGTFLTGGSQNFSLITSATNALTLSTNTSDFSDNIVVYPNPAQTTLNFSVPNNGDVSDVAIYDILGKQVYNSDTLLNHTLDVSGLSRGVYFAKFVFENKFITKKFIKE